MSELSFIIDANSPSRTILFNWDGIFLRYGDDTDGKIECSCDGKHIRIGGDIEKEPMYRWDGKFLRYAEGAGQQYQKEGTYMKLYEYDGQFVKFPNGIFFDEFDEYEETDDECLYQYHNNYFLQVGGDSKPLYEVTDNIPIEILLYIVKTFFNENDSQAKRLVRGHLFNIWHLNLLGEVPIKMNFKILKTNVLFDFNNRYSDKEFILNSPPTFDVNFNLGSTYKQPESQFNFFHHIDYYLSILYDKAVMKDLFSSLFYHYYNEIETSVDSFSTELVLRNWNGVLRHKLFERSGRPFFIGNEYNHLYNYSHYFPDNVTYRALLYNAGFLKSITTTWRSLSPYSLEIDIKSDKFPFFKFWDIKKYASYIILITIFLTVTISESIYERKPNDSFYPPLLNVALIGLFSINSNRKYLPYISSTFFSLLFLYAFIDTKDYEYLLTAFIVLSASWFFDDGYLRYLDRISYEGRIWENIVLLGIVIILFFRVYLYS